MEIESKIYECKLALMLTDEDAKRLYIKASGAGISVSELLDGFIGDLIYGRNTGGSDERDCANMWFNRRYSIVCDNDDFVRYVLMYHDANDLLEMQKSIEEYEEMLQDEEYKEDWDGLRENVDAWESNLENIYASFLKWSRRKTVNGSLDEEMEKLRVWQDGLEQFKGVSIKDI